MAVRRGGKSRPSLQGDRPRIAIAHDYLTQRGGAERVVLALTRAFPEAPVYTTLYEPTATFSEFADVDVRTSPLDRVGMLRRRHRLALPVLAMASSRTHVDADVMIASSSGWAHGFATSGAKLVYCYSPARWLYQADRYVGERGSPVVGGALKVLGPALRRWDQRAASSADRYLAISTVVDQRLRDTYGFPAHDVVPAPHTTDTAGPQETVDVEGDYFLCVSRLLPYKNVAAVVDAFRARPDRRLVVVGAGPEERRLRAGAPANVTMLKDLNDAQMRWLYAHCTALVAASYEDFGLTPLEAAAYGRPSVVLRWGGFLDTMTDGETAVFFDEPEPELIAAAVDEAAARAWDADLLRARAARFGEDMFVAAVRRHVDALLVSAGREE